MPKKAVNKIEKPPEKPLEKPPEKVVKQRADHEIIYDGQHYFINFNELIQLMDGLCRPNRQRYFIGARQAQLSLAKILDLHSAEDSGQEEARELILKYAGQ